MNFLHDLWSHEFMRRALVGGALIGFTNGFLGTFIVLRRMSLMADALSHSMLPGLALGLLVAVPAVLAYNYLQSRNKRIAEMLTGFSTEVLASIASNGQVKPKLSAGASAKPAAAPAKA